jgi:enamine deaminase RidA (YjgF/YER057c/UK114 family)
MQHKAPDQRQERLAMLRHLTPETIREPFAAYSHGVEVAAGSRLLFCSGQLGVSQEDTVPGDVGEQAELCFRNIEAVLSSAGMALSNVVRINAFVTDRAYMKAYMAVRDRLFAPPFPASTLVIVSGFARPEFKIEIEAIAAAA